MFQFLKDLFLALRAGLKVLRRIVCRIVKATLVVGVLFGALYGVVYGGFFVVKNYVVNRAGTGRDQSSEFKLQDWQDSAERQAGYRRTLTIGDAEYGFVWIPAGEFEMGSPESEEGRRDDETLHHVKLTKGFWMLETETTQAFYEEIMGENPSGYRGDDLPVETVSWHETVKFCEELTKRLPKGVRASLPTEAQWEYACRAGSKTAYSYGDSADSSKMNYDSNEGRATPAENYPANPWGLYDMHGNVWEWTSDYYAKDYPTGTAVDPTGPNGASRRVDRGGSWERRAGFCRSAYRGWGEADSRNASRGFRFILSRD